MNDLELIKAFAGLEGVNVHMVGNIDCEENLYCEDGPYWPITDLDLNCAARDKYEVEVCYRYGEALVWIESTWVRAIFKSKDEAPRAVIECILKSEGLL